MLNHKREGMPIYGELYNKYMEIVAHLERDGPAAIQAEIDEYWKEIQLRTEILSEYKGRVKL
jgi:hypothetical protein